MSFLVAAVFANYSCASALSIIHCRDAAHGITEQGAEANDLSRSCIHHFRSAGALALIQSVACSSVMALLYR
jgi:hypothetical protein